jgi:hypothetical protein
MKTYVKISSKKLGFPTHLFQEIKLGIIISSTIPSFLHSRNIFSCILTIRPNGHNSNPLNLFWELLMFFNEQIALFMGL